jgi:hypothetical protein
LPQEFRDEVRRISGYNFICDQHRLILNLEKIGSECVRMTVGIERSIRNITPEKQQIRGLVEVDEWGFPEKSQILESQVRLEDETVITFEPKSVEFKPNHQTLSAKTSPVSIGNGQSVTIFTKWSEIKRVNDDTDWTFMTPTTNAQIHISAPDGLEYECWFGAAPEKVEKSKYAAVYTTKQTYFPNQRMRARWWPKA